MKEFKPFEELYYFNLPCTFIGYADEGDKTQSVIMINYCEHTYGDYDFESYPIVVFTKYLYKNCPTLNSLTSEISNLIHKRDHLDRKIKSLNEELKSKERALDAINNIDFKDFFEFQELLKQLNLK